MSRINAYLTVFLAFTAAHFVAGPALGQDTLDEYLERLARGRQAAAIRQERWEEQRARETAAWRAAKAVAEDPLLELPNSSLPTGTYAIRLPFGVTRRVVVAEPATPTKDALSEQFYADAYAYARRLKRQLADLQIELHRLQEQDLAAEADRVHEASLSLEAAVTSRQPLEKLRGRFEECDRLWQPLAYRLAQRDQPSRFVRQASSDIEALASALNQLFSATPVVIYDRPVVAALTDELARASSNLLVDLEIEALQSVHRERLETLALRVQRQAADLDRAVKSNAALSTIIEEYEEFSRAWDRLRDASYLIPEIDKPLRVIARRVREIDVQLHPALYVNVPLLTTREQLVNLSTAITRTAAHLADDLAVDALDADQAVVYEARLFTRVAQELNRAMAQTQPADVQQQAARDFTGAWQRLEASLEKLPPARFEHGLALAAELKKEVRQLQAEFGQP